MKTVEKANGKVKNDSVSIAEMVIGTVNRFDPKRVKPDPHNPRVTFPEIPQLAESISTIGQTTPGKVTVLSGDPDFDVMLVAW